MENPPADERYLEDAVDIELRLVLVIDGRVHVPRAQRARPAAQDVGWARRASASAVRDNACGGRAHGDGLRCWVAVA